MIRHFTTICKKILERLTDDEIYRESSAGYNHYGKPCPKCGAKGRLSHYGRYDRWLISRVNNKTHNIRITPLRFECGSCGATHALLPDILTPYSPYSLRFKLTALIAYYERDTTVTTLCETLEIAVSTIYAWKGLLAAHCGLLLGMLASSLKPALAVTPYVMGFQPK